MIVNNLIKVINNAGFGSLPLPGTFANPPFTKSGLQLHALQTFSNSNDLISFTRNPLVRESMAFLSLFHKVGYLGYLMRHKNASTSTLRNYMDNSGKVSEFNYEVPLSTRSILFIKEYCPISWPEINAIHTCDLFENYGVTEQVSNSFDKNPLAFALAVSSRGFSRTKESVLYLEKSVSFWSGSKVSETSLDWDSVLEEIL